MAFGEAHLEYKYSKENAHKREHPFRILFEFLVILHTLDLMDSPIPFTEDEFYRESLLYYIRAQGTSTSIEGEGHGPHE